MIQSVLGLTGTRRLVRQRDQLSVRLFFENLPCAFEYVSGACEGVDAFAGHLLYDLYPDAQHHVIVPANRRLVDYWYHDYPNVRVTEMVQGTTYKDRNQMIVDRATWLVAVPEYPEFHIASTTSGTWQTVRMARTKQIPIHELVLHPNGEL